MIKVLVAVFLMGTMVIPAGAMEISAPSVPQSGQAFMPENTASFGEALHELFRNGIQMLRPDLHEAATVSAVIVFSAILFSIIPVISSSLNAASSLAGTVAIASVMFQNTNSMLCLASDTVWDIFEYGKMLCQVLTAALAAQGGVSTSSALYAGTMVFITLLSNLISKIVIPLISLFLAFSIANSTLDDGLLKKISDMVKGLLGWLIKTVMIIFTTYMSITGVVSGTTDTAVLKAAKLAISSAVPVVGSILSDSSESVLVSIGMAKNAAGIYGVLAVLAVFIGPFIKIGAHYILLKGSAVVCTVLGNKRISTLVEDFSSAMGLLLAVIASGCILVLISTVCFLKGSA